VDAAQSLREATALSSQIERCAIVGGDGAAVAAVPAGAGETLARAAAELLDAAPRRPAATRSVEVGLDVGSVFVVTDGSRTAVATTGPEPTSALVLHDLRACLQRISAEDSAA